MLFLFALWSHGLTNDLGKDIIQQMCKAAASAVQLQCRREHGFSDKSDARTTLPALDPKDLKGLPTI